MTWMHTMVVGGAALAVALGSSPAHAACSMDLECEGDAICEDGRCVAPLPPASTPVPSAKPAPATVRAPPRRIKSPHLLIGGITLVTIGAATLWAGMYMGFRNAICHMSSDGDTDCADGDVALSFVAVGAAIGGAGVPLILIGAKREPLPQGTAATIRPWLGARGGGVNVQIDL